MPPRTDTRARMIDSAARLLRERGVHGTSFARVIDDSGTPRGSIGHHFPGGKDEMITEAVTLAGGRITERLRSLAETGTGFAEIIATVGRYFEDGLARTDFQAGCPVAAVVFDEHLSTEVRAAALAVVDDWLAILTAVLRAEGTGERDAVRRAEQAVYAIEGALIISRLRRSTRPLERVRAHAGQI